jgi:CHAT domain-containing protein
VLFVVRPTGSAPGLSVFDLKITEKMLRKQIEELRKLIQRKGEEKAGPEDGNEAIETRDAGLTAHERELYDLLLKPAESIIASSQRLLLVPDGPLQVLPFAALKLKSGHYLVEWKPVHTAVSATVYAELKRERPSKSDKPVDVAAFGDPLYPPIAQAAVNSTQGGTVDGEVRSAMERGFNLSRLPFSRAEVQGIVGLFAGHELQYLREQATEEHAKALGKNVRYIHFATHGLLDERFPLNSSLALTIPSKPTEGQENGLLQAWEIFEQVRVDADLVTLSACSTGLGQELNGEGLIGLTRAFQYAGARSVLASLWSVDDYRTMQLMKRFYAELHAGTSKDVALQTAQSQLLHSSAKDPYYWAAFSLTGDWH